MCSVVTYPLAVGNKEEVIRRARSAAWNRTYLRKQLLSFSDRFVLGDRRLWHLGGD